MSIEYRSLRALGIIRENYAPRSRIHRLIVRPRTNLRAAALTISILLVTVAFLLTPEHPRLRQIQAQNEGICGRTQQVQDSLITIITATDDCAAVTETLLASIGPNLAISEKSIDSLMPGDFEGLTTVTSLILSSNDLRNLPTGVFSGLANLQTLRIRDNLLETIPAGTFDGLSGLTTLELANNRIENLDPEAFKGLAALQTLQLENNQLKTLPSGLFEDISSLTVIDLSFQPIRSLPSGIFDSLVALRTIRMNNADLASLPAGTFSNISSLQELRLDTNPDLTVLPSDMFAEDANLTQLKLNGTGIRSLPDNLVQSLSEVQTLELPDTLTAWPSGFVLPSTIRTIRIQGNETFRTFPLQTVFDSNNPPLYLNQVVLINVELSAADWDWIGRYRRQNQSGTVKGIYNMYLSRTGLDGTELTELINDWCSNVVGCPVWHGPHILQIVQEDLSSWLDPDAEQAVLEAQRAAVGNFKIPSNLFLIDTSMSAAQVTDLLTNLPKTYLQELRLMQNDLDGLQIGSSTFTFDQFTNLIKLRITESAIGTQTAETIINNLPNGIQLLFLNSNNIRTVPVFPNYPNLGFIYVHINPLSSLPDNVFDNVTSVRGLALSFAELESLPEGVFDELAQLYWLYLGSNNLADLRDGVFDNNGFLNEVYLDNNRFSRLPDGLFDNNPGLVAVHLSNNCLNDLPADLFDDNPRLKTVGLMNTCLTRLPRSIFDQTPGIETLNLEGNKIDVSRLDFDHLIRLRTLTLPEPIPETTPAVPRSTARIKRIEPAIRGLNIGSGDRVNLELNIYGVQDILDNSLADGVSFNWTSDAHDGLDGTGRQTVYTAPEVPGTYMVVAELGSSQCRGDETQCRAEFEIHVRRASVAPTPMPAPVNPQGPIPVTITDSQGVAYAVFTPVEGGRFMGDGFSLTAASSAVPNGEVIGISILKGEPASNVGQTHHRYVLDGDWYHIAVVDARGTPITGYRLNRAAEVCIPLPDALRSNISDLAIVAINSDDSLTILSSSVRISSSGTNVCGSLSSVPATIAAGTAGSPLPLPTEVPDSGDASGLPATGGSVPSNNGMLWALILGLAIVVSGYAVLRAAPRRNDQMR